MRIVQTKEEVDDFVRRREEVDKECWVCPACGHEIDRLPVPKLDKAASIFFNKYVMVDRFGCMACGCVWESDPYIKEGSVFNKKDGGLDYAFSS